MKRAANRVAILRSLVDEAELAEKSNETGIFKFAHEFTLQSVDRTRLETDQDICQEIFVS